jgi:hypothetical protein
MKIYFSKNVFVEILSKRFFSMAKNRHISKILAFKCEFVDEQYLSNQKAVLKSDYFFQNGAKIVIKKKLA